MAKLIGLDIGTTAIKLVELDRAGNSYKLEAVGVAATPPKGLLSEASLDQMALADAIKKLCVEAKVSTKLVNVALPENLVFTRVIDMPALSDKELSSAIRWEAEQYIPIPLSEAVLDYEIMGKNPGERGEPRMQVFLVAAQTSLIAKYQKILTSAGLTIAAIETETLAQSRALLEPSTAAPVTMVVSVGSDRTNVFIAKGQNILVAYTIPTGGKGLTRALASDLNVDQMQAEEYKKTYGLNKDVLSGKIGTTVRPLLDNLVIELRRTMSFYQAKNAEEPIRRVVLVGGSAKLPDFVVFLTEAIGIETQIGDPWQKVSDKKKLATIPYDPILFSEAVGLALKIL